MIGQSLSEFYDLGISLTKIVSQIQTSYKIQNPTNVAKTANILLCFIEFLGGGGAVFSLRLKLQYIKKHSTDGHVKYYLDLGDG